MKNTLTALVIASILGCAASQKDIPRRELDAVKIQKDCTDLQEFKYPNIVKDSFGLQLYIKEHYGEQRLDTVTALMQNDTAYCLTHKHSHSITLPKSKWNVEIIYNKEKIDSIKTPRLTY